MKNRKKITTEPTIKQAWLTAIIGGLVTSTLVVAYSLTSCNGSKAEAETEQQEIQEPQRPTYDQWLVQKDLAISPDEMARFYDIIRNYPAINSPHLTMCMTRTSNAVSYQAGYVEPEVHNNVIETVFGTDRRGLMLEQRFPKYKNMGTQKNGTLLYAGIETMFEDIGLPVGDGIADNYVIFMYDALGETPLIPTAHGSPSRTVSINTEMRRTYASGEDPLTAGLGSFEQYRQAAYTEALRRFLTDPQNNKACD